MNKTYHIQTMGCQMNEHDSETIAGLLTEIGFSESKERDNAGVFIINTCSVRDNADQRFFGVLGQLKKRKEEGDDFLVCVCGCMMQQQHIVDTIKGKYPWVDIIFGTHNIHEFPKLVESVMSERKKLVDVWEDGGEIIEGLPAKRLCKHKSFVNIMYGCNNFCTYCIVPYTRGRERSRKPEEIIKEVKELALDGVKEITLLGQNVNSYKGMSEMPINKSMVENTCGGSGCVDFAELLYMLNDIEGIERIRFMTSHPKDLSDQLIQAYKNCSKLCKHIHLPVQSGSNDVLKRMNRKYTKEGYLDIVKKLREAVPNIAITTDIIVGFPGESEEDFEETLDLCRQVGYDSAFTFIYSVRKGTPAEKYENQIPEDIKHSRFNRLVDVINQSSAEKNAAYIGKKIKVLTESVSKNNSRMLSGRTESFKTVNFQGDKELIGQTVNLEIIEANTFTLTGRSTK